jgi:ankyrin repeat protein
VQVLLDHGASPLAQDANGKTPLNLAFEGQNGTLVALIKKHTGCFAVLITINESK